MRRVIVLLVLAAVGGLVARGAVPCAAFGLQPRCYVALHPGPAEDGLQMLSIDGAPSYASSGELLFTTVWVDPELDLREWLHAAVTARIQEVPREVIYPSGEDRAEFNERNIAEMDRSKLDAAAAALRYLGHDVDLRPKGAEVVELLAEEVSLETGDVVVAVDGRRVRSARDVLDEIGDDSVDERIVFTVRRGGEADTRSVRLREDPEGGTDPWLPAVLRDHVVLPVDIDIDVGDVGGPSAGLMFAISIIDALDPDDLTGGAVIAGTGTIDADGAVGAVGGIHQKLLGALERAGRPATAFLAPTGDFAEARGAPVDRDILVVPVATLEEAMTALADLREGRRPPDAIALGP